MVFGVFQIILGLLAALMVPLVALGAFMSRLAPGGATRPAQFLSGVASYAFIAAALLALGIGSVQMKRWAHALTLVTSVYWLIMGALITVLLTAMLPVTMRSALTQAQHNAANAPSQDVVHRCDGRHPHAHHYLCRVLSGVWSRSLLSSSTAEAMSPRPFVVEIP